ncbi:MAG: phosphate ABC transporter, permease protein PstA [Rickettsiales bacterium]|nr:phosphate ABC transporter, permease protein PstA [Rickettsiales bacterium]
MDSGLRPSRETANIVRRGLKKRYAAEQRFKLYGLLAVCAALAFLVIMLGNIIYKGHTAFIQTEVKLEIYFDEDVIDPTGKRDEQTLRGADYGRLIKTSLRKQFPNVQKRRDKRKLYRIVSAGSPFELYRMVQKDPSLIGKTQAIWISAAANIDILNKGGIDTTRPETERRVNNKEISWYENLREAGLIRADFNTRFFTAGDSRDPEQAGVLGAVIGSLLTLAITLLLSFPFGVMTAIYLEEFAPQNRWTDIIEVNINNLAAVPSIVFGLLGLAVFLNFFGLPRSAPLVGGMVLALMTLPTIIIASRAALKSVPPSIREAALGVGASRMQVVTDHVAPLAMPGILTGTIIGMARALGESAPLLMIGMVAFIVDVPQSPTDPATVLPVQVYLWADSPERAFVERTSAAIIVLIGFLVCMNLTAQILRQKFEKHW